MIKKLFSKLTYEDVKDGLLMLMIIIFGLLGAARGLIWIVNGDQVLESATVYKKVAEFLPIQTLGLLFFVGGVMVILGAVTKYMKSFLFLTIGGLLSTLCGVPMYMASVLEGINNYTPISVAIVAGGNMILALAGVVLFWTEKNRQNM